MKINKALQLLVMLKSLVVCSPSGLQIVPTSQNVTVGSIVEFSCGTIDSALNILWFYEVPATESTYQLSGGGFVRSLRLNAQVEHNDSRFDCYLLNGTVQLEYREVTLLIQGQSAYSTFLSHYHFSLHQLQDLLLALVIYQLLNSIHAQLRYHGSRHTHLREFPYWDIMFLLNLH